MAEAKLSFRFAAQHVDWLQFPFGLEMPVGPAVARGLALHERAEPMDRRLLASAREGAVGANFRTMPAPNPEAPPVTIATLPSSLMKSPVQFQPCQAATVFNVEKP